MKTILKNKLFVLFSAFIMLFCGVIGVKALKPSAKVSADEVASTPTLTIESNNVSYAESVYILYAVGSDGFDRTSYEIKLLFWEEPQEDYAVGTEAYSVTSEQTTTINGKDCLVFYSDGLAAKEMTDNVYARACVEIDGVIYYSAPSKCSVLEYVYTMREQGGLTSEQTAIFDAMLEYGAAAQNLFDYNTGRLANATYYAVSVENGTLADGFDFDRYVYGELVEITADPAPDGLIFSHWKDKDGSMISQDTTAEITVTDDNTYTAVYLPENAGSESEHTCITDGAWQMDETAHWLVCTCGETVQYAEHSYGALSDGEQGMAYYCVCGDYLTNDDLVDFVVEVESGKDPVVLQLSDTQTWWWGDTAENQCYRYIREVVEETKPDLIILTGDIVYGKFDPEGNLLVSLIDFMETLNTPWAPVFGNHDNESLMGVDWQCAQLEAAGNCLFKQGDLTGNGNYSVGIEQDGELLRVFYMMDSNGCSSPMIDSDGNATTPEAGTNVVKTTQGFGQDQIDWYTDEINAIHALDADVKISMAYHIQQAIFEKAFQKYDEYDGLTTNSALNNPLNLDTMETADDTDFGYLGRPMKGGWDYDYAIFNGMKALGVDSIFVGHEHCNSVSIVYEGVRFQYGQKSSTYDRYNYVTADGTITGGTATPAGAHALLGGTVIPVSGEDGSIGTGYICYYGDPFYFEPEPEPVPVEGLQYGTDLTVESDKNLANGSFQAVAYDENTNAYYIESGTSYNRLYINVDLLRGQKTVSFDILVPEEATKADGSATQEFAIRVKENEATTGLFGWSGGYLWYDASYTNEWKVIIGEWQTITIDISAYADVCTEFGIYFVEGNNGAYIKNVAVSETAIDDGTGDDGTSEEIVVNGMAFSNVEPGITATAETKEGANAYKVTATKQGKAFLDLSALEGKSTLTFTTYVAEIASEANSAFWLRIKHSGKLKAEDSAGYIYYQVGDKEAAECVVLGQWQTFTVDIADLGTCTEFAFAIPAGGTVWFRDIAVGEEIVVGGSEFSEVASAIAVTAETKEGANAYKVTASSQDKVYLDTALFEGKTTLSFTVYVEENAGNTCIFMIRLKANGSSLESSICDQPGYIYYQAGNRITLGEWQTFTIDISSCAEVWETATQNEFSFVITAGQTVWFRDITIS